MMKKSTDEKNGKSFRVLLFFCSFVLLLLLISFSIRIVSIISVSKFDGNHRFTLAVLQNKAQIISFAPDAKTLSVLTLRTSTPNPKHLKRILHIPIDSSIQAVGEKNYLSQVRNLNGITVMLQRLIFSPTFFQTDMTIIDKIQLWMFVRSLSPEAFLSDSFTDKSVEKIESARVDKTVTQLFADQSFSQENKTIQISNASTTSGLGSEYAQILTNMGGNVISVTSSHTESDKTTIQYFGEYSYTVKKIEQIFQKKAKRVKKRLPSDIIIIIGEESAIKWFY